MSFIQQLQTNVSEKFLNAKVQGAHSLSLRNGYCFIRKVTLREMSNRGLIPVAEINWKATQDEKFYEDVVFHVTLSNLQSVNPDKFEITGGQDLAGITLLISDGRVYTQFVDGVETSKFDCKYQVISEPPIFTNAQAELIIGFGGQSKTLCEAYNNFEKELGLDLSEAIDKEGLHYDDALNCDDIPDNDE